MEFNKPHPFDELIRQFISEMEPSKLGFNDPLIIKDIKFLGIGTGNLNILVNVNHKKFIFRYSINRFRRKLFFYEYSFLFALNGQEFIPKIRYCEPDSKNIFGIPFMILDYIEGKCLSEIDYKINKNLISKLAIELSKIHSLDSSKLSVREESIFIRINRRLKFFRKRLSIKNYNAIKNLYTQILKLSGTPNTVKTIIHANIWEGNIIQTNQGIKIIDYETVCFDDPAVEIAHIFHDFKTGYFFTNEEKDIFINTYQKYRKDKTLKKRINSLFFLDVFDSFLRVIEYSLISNEEKSNKFIQSGMDKNSGMEILKIYFRNLKKLEIINKNCKLCDFYSPV